jgi:hypothetical protein
VSATRLELAEEVSTALSKSLPLPNPLVDHFREEAVWDQAIIESLATFARAARPLPADVRAIVEGFLREPRLSSKVRRRSLYHLKAIPS